MWKVSRRGAVSPFLVMEVFREANEYIRTGGDAIHLSLGQPGREAPVRALQKGAEYLLNGKLGYTEATGIPPLRERISRHYRETYGLDIAPERIFVTVGSSAAFFLAMIAAFDGGSNVAITLPCYPAYPNMLKALEINPVYLRGNRANNFQPKVEMLKALPEKPDGLIFASPSNPAGTILDADTMQEILSYTDANHIRVLSDEIYHGVTYDGKRATTALAYSDKVIVVNSFSKYFLLPGWRLGWAVLPEDMVRSYESLMQSFFISPPALAQQVALATFDCKDELDETVQLYARNRDVMLKALPEAGFDDLAPAEGAFYIYADVSKLTNDSRDFCRRMLHEAGVVAVPGMDFDPVNGNSTLRFSFSASTEEVEEAMLRLRKWLKK